MNFFVIVFVVALASCFGVAVDATKCEPFSTFKIDCDECQCSEDGTEYSCTIRNCGPFAFLGKQDDYNRELKKLQMRMKNGQTEAPLMNDEISSSLEEVENEYAENTLYDEIKAKEGSKNDKEVLDYVDLAKQDGLVFDTGEPEIYKRKRYFDLHDKRHRHRIF